MTGAIPIDPDTGGEGDRSGAVPAEGRQPPWAENSASRRFDFPGTAAATAFYVVAATPRSGSSLLCRHLWATGVLGAPMEYFNYQRHMLQMAGRLRPVNLHDYVRKLLSLRTSPNGVFGFRASLDQFRIVVDGGILGHFAGLRYIHLDRLDRVAQAVSLVRAAQTGQWVSWRSAHRRPVYDRAAIAFHLTRLKREAAQWKAMFQRDNIQPLSLSYETLIAGPEAVVEDGLRRFGQSRNPARRIELPMPRRQADATNQEWIERFHRESKPPAGSDPV